MIKNNFSPFFVAKYNIYFIHNIIIKYNILFLNK